jgi:hypothetical protein
VVLKDRNGDELNDDGTRHRDNWFLQQIDRANFTALDRKMDAERRERERRNDEFWERHGRK